jgi:hypothetical protein
MNSPVVFTSEQLTILNTLNQKYLSGDIVVVEPVAEDVSTNGVDGNTTAYLNYGINVITTADASNFAIRLPYPPVKGKTVTIINTTAFSISVYPSIVGGSINGVVDGVAIIPADKKSYFFTCWENPLPGAWSWTPPATNQFDSGIVNISHTNGNSTSARIWNDTNKFVGTSFPPISVGNSLSPQLGYYFNGTKITFTRIKVYSNIPIAPAGYGSFFFDLNQYNFYVGNSGSSNSYSATANALVSGGSTNTPLQVGDNATLYAIYNVSELYSIDDIRLNNGTFFNPLISTDINVFSSTWIQLDPSLATGTYQFRIFLEYN